MWSVRKFTIVMDCRTFLASFLCFLCFAALAFSILCRSRTGVRFDLETSLMLDLVHMQCTRLTHMA